VFQETLYIVPVKRHCIMLKFKLIEATWMQERGYCSILYACKVAFIGKLSLWITLGI